MRGKFIKTTYCLLLTVCCLLVFGCGYSLQGKADLPFRSVGIGKIINTTFEPQLADKMQTALVNELLKNGFEIDNSSGYRINGTITAFELKTLSEKAGVASEYEVILRGNFMLTDPSGKARGLRSRGVFIVSFLSAESLQSVIALKEQATERALKDFSAEIIASILYGDSSENTASPRLQNEY